MDAYLNPQPKSGARQPPQAGAAEVPSPSQQPQQQQDQQEQQQPAPSGTSDVAGAGAGKHAKTSPVLLYYREVPVVTEGGKNVMCTVSRTIPATGKAPERTVECGLALTYRRQTDSRKGSGTSGILDHLKRKHMKAWQDVQNRSSSSATTKKKLGEIYHAVVVRYYDTISSLYVWCSNTDSSTAVHRAIYFYFFTIRKISVIVYWLSLTVRVLLAMYWHFRGGRYYYY